MGSRAQPGRRIEAVAHTKGGRTGWSFSLASLLLILGGCATLTVVPAERLAEQRLTTAAEPVAHIYAANWGLYLFKYLPIITGSLARPGVPQWPSLFSDEVQIDRFVEKVSAESKQRGGEWTLIFWLNEFEVSANSSRSP